MSGGDQILHVVGSEQGHVQGRPIVKGDPTALGCGRVGRRLVSDPLQVGSLGFHLVHQAVQQGVLCAVDHRPTGLDSVEVQAKLFDVILFSGEHIDVVPGNACDHGDVGAVPQEFGPHVDGAAQILVALDDGPFMVFLEIHHPVKPVQLCAHHQVGGAAFLAHGMQDHRGDGGFSMAAGHHHSLFLGRRKT